MATQTLVIGCPDAARFDAMARSVTARRAVTVVDAWPLEQALAAAARDESAVAVVLDGFPPSAALRAMADLTRARPELDVLVLGPLRPDVEILVALASGASGYLPATSTPSAVASAVDALMAGAAVLPRAVSHPLVEHLRRGDRGVVVGRADGRQVVLTNREWEVLVLLRQGRGTSEIARRLVVASGTVRSHVAAVVRKLGVRDRAELT